MEKSSTVAKTSRGAMDFVEEVVLVPAASRPRPLPDQNVWHLAAMKGLPFQARAAQRCGVRLRAVVEHLAVRESLLHQEPVALRQGNLLRVMAELTSNLIMIEGHPVQRLGPQTSFLRRIRSAEGAALLRAVQKSLRQTVVTAMGPPLAAVERALAVRCNPHPVLKIASVEHVGIKIEA